MTIERARQLLGDEISDLNDKEVGELLKRAGLFCSALLDIALDYIINHNNPACNKNYDQNGSSVHPGKRSFPSR